MFRNIRSIKDADARARHPFGDPTLHKGPLTCVRTRALGSHSRKGVGRWAACVQKRPLICTANILRATTWVSADERPIAYSCSFSPVKYVPSRRFEKRPRVLLKVKLVCGILLNPSVGSPYRRSSKRPRRATPSEISRCQKYLSGLHKTPELASVASFEVAKLLVRLDRGLFPNRISKIGRASRRCWYLALSLSRD
ncbi:hypothetical protein BCR34DRAFT_265537 [Clohesyomyces aquaticus]|uniref:Uncharacterized protein n=1 Tax=Clohesyomyces aquaticus TaxID=1231657 RepID=A0A1Y1ZTJ1_9PLEO|nr:hypothetical protein BCR34DRAFT_265537 [Clohesyomyces aquaticus]